MKSEGFWQAEPVKIRTQYINNGMAGRNNECWPKCFVTLTCGHSRAKTKIKNYLDDSERSSPAVIESGCMDEKCGEGPVQGGERLTKLYSCCHLGFWTAILKSQGW